MQDDQNTYWQSKLSVKGNVIVLSASDAYSPLILTNTADSSHKYLFESQSFVQHLINTYADVHLKLHPSINDIRPFIWANFIALKRYTYVVDLNEITNDLLQAIPEYKKWSHLQVMEKALTPEDIEGHVQFLKPFVKSTRIQKINSDLLQNIKQLSTLSIINEEHEIAAQMIFNKNTSYAAQLFYRDTPDFKRNRGGVFAQYAFMQHFKNKGYSQFDFCGANIKSIATFKSRFPVQLVSFYELWHHQNKIKNTLRKFLFHQV
jgi:hypothetical protein